MSRKSIRAYPKSYTAALLGPGSDVLGYDDVRSTDRYWGPRLQVFIDERDVEAAKGAIEALPGAHLGWPTSIGSDQIPLRQHVDVWTVSDWCNARLGLDPRLGVSNFDWLALPQQLLLESTAGRVFHDGLGQLESVRESLAWYPHDVWLWLLAAQWTRVAQEEAFVGRAAEAGDELGRGCWPPGSCAISCGCASSSNGPTPHTASGWVRRSPGSTQLRRLAPC